MTIRSANFSVERGNQCLRQGGAVQPEASGNRLQAASCDLVLRCYRARNVALGRLAPRAAGDQSLARVAGRQRFIARLGRLRSLELESFRGVGTRKLGVPLPLRSTTLVLACFLLQGAALAQDSGSSPQQQQFMGSAVCQGCHPTVWEAFTRNPHFRSVAMDNQPPERTGCEGCHGPAFLHILNLDKEQIVRFPPLTPIEKQRRCLECHAGDFGKMHVHRSAHLTSEVGCTSCHSIHSAHEDSALLSGQQRQLCYSCHQEIRARFEMPFKHRVNEGAMECTDCHNPHGAPVATWGGGHSARMVAQALGNDLPCFRCHPDKRGPFLHPHPPVALEGCFSCHEPHGSTNPRLLNRPTPFTLCMECHSDIAGFGVRAGGIPGPTRWTHNLSDPAFRECLHCHAKIHGSNTHTLLR